VTKYAKNHPKTHKSPAVVEEVGRLHLELKSNAQIARRLGLSRDTVSSLVDRSKLVEEFRLRLLDDVPRLLENFRMLTTPGTPHLSVEELGRNTRWGLEQTQIGVKREVQEHEVHNPLSALSDDELAALGKQLDRIIDRAGLAQRGRRGRKARQRNPAQ